MKRRVDNEIGVSVALLLYRFSVLLLLIMIYKSMG